MRFSNNITYYTIFLFNRSERSCYGFFAGSFFDESNGKPFEYIQTRAYVIITFYDYYYLTQTAWVCVVCLHETENFHRTYVLFKLHTEKYA